MAIKVARHLSTLLLPLGLYGIPAQAYGGYSRTHTRQGAGDLSHSFAKNFSLDKLAPPKVSSPGDLKILKSEAVSELVIVDAAVPDKAALYRAVKPHALIVELNPDEDGLVQLTRALGQYQGLAAVHIVSHAQAGELSLGNSRITAERINGEIKTFNAFRQALRPDGDILFYGCDLAAGESGEQLLEIIQNQTQLDVAASTNKTGNPEQGGDWDLELVRGEITTQSPFSEHALKDFTALLATYSASDFCNSSHGGSYQTAASFTSSDGAYTVASFNGYDVQCGQNGNVGYYMGGDVTLRVRKPGNADFSVTGLHLGGGCPTVYAIGYDNGLRVAYAGPSTTSAFNNYPDMSDFSGKQIDEMRVGISGCTGLMGISSFSVPDPNTPPTFQNSTPSLSSITATGATLAVRLNETGTAYYVVVANNAGAPSSAQVKAGQDSAGAAATASGSLNITNNSSDFTTNITGLTGATDYDVYVVAEDGVSLLQTSPTKLDLTTSTPIDNDASLTAAGGVSEPVGIDTTIDTAAEAIDVFDFTISDGGTADGLATTVTQVVLHISGTSTDAERSKVTWRLNGPDVTNEPGTYSAAGQTITFSGLSISVADSGNETYTLNAYYNDTGTLVEDHTFIFSVDGDTDLTVGGSGTQMSSTSAVTNGSGGTIDVVASELRFTTQPAGSVSGSALSTQPVITATDASGNTDVDFTEVVTLTEASAGGLTGNTQTASSGVATFAGLTYSATADQQSFTLTANDQDGVGSNLPTVNANSVTSDVVATRLLFNTQPAPTTVSSGVATAMTTVPVVAAVDANGITDTGYSTDVVLSELNGAGSAVMSASVDNDVSSATVTLTPASGLVSFSGLQLTYTASGSSDENFNLRAESGGLTIADSTQMTATVAPIVSDARISISGASGTGGAFKVGDTVTATWNNTASGDNNSGITGVTVDFSQFGGGAAVTAVESSGTWSATYTIVAGGIDATGRNISVTATNASGSTTVADTTSATVDNSAPTLTDTHLSISGASGTGGDYKIGDTVTATWSNTVGGDNNSDTVSSVTVNFTSFGGGAAVAATESSGTWSASYTIVAGAIDSTNLNVSFTATDNAGNSTTTADTTNATVDNIAATVSSVTVPANATYITGENLDFTLNTSENVTVDTTGGVPQLALTLGATTRQATYLSGSGTSALVFRYTVQAGDSDSDGIAVATSLDANGGTLRDDSGNNLASGLNAVGSTAGVLVDAVAPTVSSIAPSGSPAANASSVVYTVAFSKPVNNLSVDDFALTATGTAAGTIASVSATAGSSVDVTVNNISGTGSLRLDLNGSTNITDTAGNAIAAFSAGSPHTVDRDAPAAASTPDLVAGSDTGASSTDNVTSDTTPSFSGTAEAGATVTLNSSVSGAIGTATATAGVWSITSTALPEGVHTITATVTDAAGNDSIASSTLALTVDTSAASGHSVSFDESAISGAESASVSFSFANAEVGADYSYTISSTGGGTAVTGSGTFASVTEQVNAVDLSGLGDGTVTVSVTVTDTAGNTASAITANATLDQTAPAAVINTTAIAPVNNAFTATIAFAEVVTGFTVDDVVAGNATLSNFTDTGAGNFSVLVTPVSDGTVTLDVAAAAAQDTAGNNSLAASQLSLSYDGSAPEPVFTTTEANPGNSASFNVTLDFGEPVSTFQLSQVSATNASLSGLNDQGNGLYSFTATAAGDGTVAFNYAAGAVQDSAGNNNLAANPLSLTHDSTAPVLASSVPADGASDVAPDTGFTLTFSEAVQAGSGNLTLFDAADNSAVEVFSAGSLSIAGNSVTFAPGTNLTATHSYYLQVAATAFSDEAGNAYAGITDQTTINFTVANAAPVAANDTATVAEDAAVDIAVLANDTDSDSALNAASVTIVTAPAHGSTSINTANGVVTFSPQADFNGSDSFSYTVEDVYSGLSNVATVSITVSAVNDAPVAAGDMAATQEDVPVSIDVAANDTDRDTGDAPDTDTITIVAQPDDGTAQVVDGQVLYTPAQNFNGSASFTYTIEDSAGAVSNTATVVVNVTSVNDLPVAANDTAVVDEDSSVDIDVLANDSDVDGAVDASTVSLLSAAGHGITNVDALTGVITYTPQADFHGSDSFTYVVQDNSGGSASATVTITVNSVNDAPVANADVTTLQEDTAHTINVLGNDTDVDGTLATLQIVTAPAEGSAAVSGAAMVYTPGENFNGSDSFTYRVQDNDGAWSAAATVSLTILDVNDVPLANDDEATTDEDTAVTINLLGNDNDVDGSLDVAGVTLSTPANGSVADNGDGTVRYTPAENFFGVDSFSYTVLDDDGARSNSASVTVRVDPVNDTPAITGTPPATVTQDGSYEFSPVTTDADEQANLTFSVVNLPAWASFDTATGAIAGTPGNADVGSYENIVVSVSDGETVTTLPAFSLTVENVNDAPVAVADRYSVGEGELLQASAETGVLANDSDIDAGDVLRATLISPPARAANFSLNADGSFSYRHNGSETRADTFTYALSDGTVTLPPTTVSVSITPVNDAPVFASVPASTTLRVGDTLSYRVGVTDPDSVVDVILSEGPSWLSFDGSLLSGLVPADAENFAVVLTASDQALTVTQNLSFEVTATENAVVQLTGQWQGVPAVAGDTLQLALRLQHTAGPALTDSTMQVSVSGAAATINGCNADGDNQFLCSFSLAAGATLSRELTLTTSAEGDVIVTATVTQGADGPVVGELLTDASVAAVTVAQGNATFNLKHATSLASIELGGGAGRELVAGTNLDNPTVLLDYDSQTAIATLLGEIDNRGYTRQVLVADIDADSLDDLVLINSSGEPGDVYYSRGELQFEAQPGAQILPYAKQGVLHDLSGDGLPELIIGARGRNLYIYPNNNGVFDTEPFILDVAMSVQHFALHKGGIGAGSPAPYSGRLALASADELVLLQFGLQSAQSKTGSPAQSEQYLSAQELSRLPVAGVTGLLSADLNGDGEDELIMSTEHTNNSASQSGTSIVETASGNLSVAARLGNASARNVSLADFNGDGNADLLVANDNNVYQFYHGSGQVADWALRDTAIFNPSSLVLPDDVDGDGLSDVLIYEDDVDEVRVYISKADSVGASADLALTAAAEVTSSTEYQWRYTLTVTNNGDQAAQQVVVSANLPPDVSVTRMPDACVQEEASVRCSLGELPASAAEPVVLELQATKQPRGSASGSVRSAAVDPVAADNTVSTNFAELFPATRVQVSGGGKRGGALEPFWLLLLVTGVMALRGGGTRRWLVLVAALFSAGTQAQTSEPSFAPNNEAKGFAEFNLGRAISYWQEVPQGAGQNLVLSDIDDSRGTVEWSAGYYVLPWLAVEGGYRDWGQVGYALTGVATSGEAVVVSAREYAPASGKGFFGGLRLSYRPAATIETYLKLQAWRWEGDYRVTVGDRFYRFEQDGSDALVGLGVNWYFLPRVYFGMQFQQVSLDGQRNSHGGVQLGVLF